MKNLLKNAFWTAAALCLLLAVLLTASVRRQASELASRVVRLHVVAASDEAAEQAVKLEVRDAVLELVAPRLAGCESREEAEAELAASLGDIEETARRVYGGGLPRGRRRRPEIPLRRVAGKARRASRRGKDALRPRLPAANGRLRLLFAPFRYIIIR